MQKVAVNDPLIEYIILSPYHRIIEDGLIFTLIDRQGWLQDIWRQTGLRADENGYLSLSWNHHQVQVHRIIYRKFNGPLDPLLEINHIDGVVTNNKPYNLELVTHGKNLEHSFRVLGRKPVIGNFKISQEIAQMIRVDKAAGLTNREMRLKYGLAKSSISYIVNGRTWKGSVDTDGGQLDAVIKPQ